MYYLLVCLKGHVVENVVVSRVNNALISCTGEIVQLYVLY